MERKPFTILLSEEEKKIIEKESRKEGLSISSYIRQVILKNIIKHEETGFDKLKKRLLEEPENE